MICAQRPILYLSLALVITTPAAAQKFPARYIADISENGACNDEQLSRIQDVYRLAADIEKWGPIVKAAGIKSE